MQQLHAGRRGLAPILLTSRLCNTCTRGGIELWLQTLCICHRTLKQKKKLVTRASTTIDISWLGTVEAFNHLVKLSVTITRCWFPSLVWGKSRTVFTVTSWMEPWYCTDVSPWSLVHRPHTTGCLCVTVPTPLPQCLSFPEANSNFVWHCPRCCLSILNFDYTPLAVVSVLCCGQSAAPTVGQLGHNCLL